MLWDDTRHQVKLADFGTSVRCEHFLQDNVPRGTEPFMAPEVSNMVLIHILLTIRLTLYKIAVGNSLELVLSLSFK